MVNQDSYTQHISEQFNTELEAVKTHMLEMGGLVEAQLSAALENLVNSESGTAGEVVARDRDVESVPDALERVRARLAAAVQVANRPVEAPLDDRTEVTLDTLAGRIAGETGDTYVLQAADSDAFVRVVVTATDDGSGNLSDSQNVSITVTDANEAPVMGADTAVNVVENTTAVGTYAATDVDGDTQHVRVISDDQEVQRPAELYGQTRGGCDFLATGKSVRILWR